MFTCPAHPAALQVSQVRPAEPTAPPPSGCLFFPPHHRLPLCFHHPLL